MATITIRGEYDPSTHIDDVELVDMLVSFGIYDLDIEMEEDD